MAKRGGREEVVLGLLPRARCWGGEGAGRPRQGGTRILRGAIGGGNAVRVAAVCRRRCVRALPDEAGRQGNAEPDGRGARWWRTGSCSRSPKRRGSLRP